MDRPSHHDDCHVYIDSKPQSGAWNMAADELLLQAAVERGRCSVRIYRWSEPTLSLGYFQSLDAIPEPLQLVGLPVVRRLSGGGTILHHHELTYACALPARHELSHSPTNLYRVAHAVIIEQLGRYGISARLRGTADPRRRLEFLCFARGDSFDVVMGAEHKVVGSAQRRRKGAILQHGSVVLRRSEFATQFPGIADLAENRVSEDELAAVIADGLAARFSAKVVRAEFDDSEDRWLRQRSIGCVLRSATAF